MRKYKILMFDLDDTLLDFSRTEEESLKEIFKRYNVEDTQENIDAYKKINSALWAQLEFGNKTKDEIIVERFIEFFNIFNIDIDGAKVEEEYRNLLDDSHYMLDGAYQTLERLYKEDYRIFAATNGLEITQLKRMKDAKIIDFFEDIFISEVIGYEKPSKEFFDYVSTNIKDFVIDETLMIGDRLSADIIGASNYGINTCWINANDEQSDMPTYTLKTVNEIFNILDK
ncbi:MAG: YjjG family noncanonical pyrimidine nucleotidase [Erysipelotrichales bacterium]